MREKMECSEQAPFEQSSESGRERSADCRVLRKCDIGVCGEIFY